MNGEHKEIMEEIEFGFRLMEYLHSIREVADRYSQLAVTDYFFDFIFSEKYSELEEIFAIL